MPRSIDRFLKQAPVYDEGPSLGRIFAVTRETWLLAEDPKRVDPKAELLVSRRTALEAADVARKAAAAFEQHGFHKPSGAWWASDGVRIHRYVVHPAHRRGSGGLVLATVLAAGAALAVVGMARTRKRRVPSRA